jgi:hypothetical protein
MVMAQVESQQKPGMAGQPQYNAHRQKIAEHPAACGVLWQK